MSMSTRPTSTDVIDNNDDNNVTVSLRDKKPRQQHSTKDSNMIDEAEEWRKIEEILANMHRDSFFADSTSSQVAVTVKNRKSQALTLQLMNPSSSPRYSNMSYPSEHDDLSTKRINDIDNKIILWLNNNVGLPLARAREISEILEKNGFDNITFMKGTLTKSIMNDMGIDKSIQHQISIYLDNEICQIPSIDMYDYASDWLSGLNLFDYLELFALNELTSIKKIQSSRLTIMDLRLFGIELIGHLERIIKSIKMSDNSDMMSSSVSTLPTSIKSSQYTTTDTDLTEKIQNKVQFNEKNQLLLKKCISYSAHYLGSSEISNVEGAEDCRRAMNLMKGRIRQINKVPQVLLQVSAYEVNVLDSITNVRVLYLLFNRIDRFFFQNLVVQHEINRIEIVCQDELDLNCFAYIFQDGDKHFCHVYCVLTAVSLSILFVILIKLYW